MRIYIDGRRYAVQDLTGDEVMALREMISGAAICERRKFYDLKRQIDDLEEQGLMSK